jgi:hypothetical protein
VPALQGYIGYICTPDFLTSIGMYPKFSDEY